MKVKKIEKSDHKSLERRLGEDLRALRRANRLTLEQLAEKSGKSVGFISKIERGLARPSITALQDIAEPLGVPAGWFLESDGPVPAGERPYIVRRNRRRKLTYSGLSGTAYMGFEDHLLSATLDGKMALGISTYQPGGSTGDDLYQHQGEEAGLVLTGEIEVTLDDQIFVLQPGDSFSFSAAIPHRYRNVGEGEATIVWANTPVSLRR